MKAGNKKKQVLFLLIPPLFAFSFTLCGCIRLSTTAGYSYQGPNDESPKSKQIGFDTQNLLPKKNPGNIEIDG